MIHRLKPVKKKIFVYMTSNKVTVKFLTKISKRKL